MKNGVWFSDLDKVVKVFREKVPQAELFNSISGNIYGDFLIETSGNNTYIVTHDTLKVYQLKKDTYKWEEVV